MNARIHEAEALLTPAITVPIVYALTSIEWRGGEVDDQLPFPRLIDFLDFLEKSC